MAWSAWRSSWSTSESSCGNRVMPMLADTCNSNSCATPLRVQELLLQVSASIGITLFPQDDSEVDQLLRHADQAMYQAKQLGKNRYHLFDPVHDARMRSRAGVLAALRLGLDQQQFELHYQPKVNMRTGAVVGVEALLRWHHPSSGLLHPPAFLP